MYACETDPGFIKYSIFNNRKFSCMKKNLLWLLLIFITINISAQKTFTLSKEALKDKIMGGWAGQTIGVTFGGPYEFRFQGTFIQDYQPLVWYDGLLKDNMTNNAGLYDDLYMD